MMLLFALAMFIITPLRIRFKFESEDFFLIGAVAAGILGLLYAPEYGQRTLNHTLAIFACITLYYFFAKGNIWPSLKWPTVVDAIAIITVFSGCFIIVEFILSNFLGVQVSEFVPYMEMRLTDLIHEDSTMMGIWVRPRGFAIEAGHMATIFELGLPCTSIAFRNRNNTLRLGAFLVALIGFLLLASAAATTALILSAAVVGLRRGIASKARFAIMGLFVALAITIASSRQAQEYFNDLIYSKALGFIGLAKEENMSAFDRSQRAKVAIDIATDFPLGFGWGTGAHLGSGNSTLLRDVPFGFISLYAEFLVAGGWLGLVSLVAFFVFRMKRTARIRSQDSDMLLIGMLSLSIHYITISNYWFPVLWIAYGLVSSLEEHAIRERQFPWLIKN
jgi:hypothetical protein